MKLFVIVVALLCALTAHAVEKIGLTPTGYVNDFAGIIDRSTKTNLERILTAYNNATTIEIAVATVKSLNDMVIDDYATRLFEEWKIGAAKKDNGVLFVVAPNEKKMRIEVGYGLEGAINDAKAGRIINSTAQYFKSGDFSGGINNAVLDIMANINQAENITFDPKDQPELAALATRKPKEEEKNNFLYFLPFIILFVIFLTRAKPRSGNAGRAAAGGIWFLGGLGGGGSSGGFGGGGFGGFGGGFSGGGGASGGW